jgi:hypothetical protein
MLFFDGFDGYDAVSDLTSFGGWSNGFNGNGDSISTAVRVGSGKCFKVGNNQGIKLIFSANQSTKTIYAGFAYKPAVSGNGNSICEFENGTEAILSLVLNATNNLEIRRGNYFGTVLGTGSMAFSTSSWGYIEIKAFVENTVGKVEVLVNGIVDIAEYTGDTQYAATDSVASFTVGGRNSGIIGYYDDFYILNSDSSINNTYLGEVVINRLAQTGDSSIAFTRNTGATNYEAVGDLVGAPDDSTTYVYATTSGTRDEYTLSNTVSANTIYGVKINTRAQKDDVNPKSFKNGIKTGATQQDVTHSLGIGYTNYIDIFETSDGGTTLWTPTTLDAAVSTIEVV